MMTRPIYRMWDVAPVTGWSYGTLRGARWSRGRVVRTSQPAFRLPPYQVMRDPTDPKSWAYTGGDRRPY